MGVECLRRRSENIESIWRIPSFDLQGKLHFLVAQPRDLQSWKGTLPSILHFGHSNLTSRDPSKSLGCLVHHISAIHSRNPIHVHNIGNVEIDSLMLSLTKGISLNIFSNSNASLSAPKITACPVLFIINPPNFSHLLISQSYIPSLGYQPSHPL